MRFQHRTLSFPLSPFLYTVAMSTAKLLERVPLEEYLNGEKDSPIKHEYVHGHVYAMAGASDAHNRIVMNLSGQLYQTAERAGCQNYASDMKVRVNDYVYYYPDFIVVCAADEGDYTKENPCLIVEVLSRTTRATDLREKREAYLAMPTLRSYLLIDSERRSVTSYERGPEGWLERQFDNHGEVAFGCLSTSLSLDDIYRNLDLP